MRRAIYAAIAVAMLSCAARADYTVNIEHCKPTVGSTSLRQTVVVIDGGIVVKDSEDGPSAANQGWRRFASDFVDANSPLIGQLVDSRERLTIAIANSDGSGLTPIFSGCVPLVSEEEATKLDAETSNLDVFFGRDWRSQNEKAAAAFARSARVAMIRSTEEAVVGATKKSLPFAQGALVASMRNSPGFDLSDGLVRYVILTDLNLYVLQASDVVTARAQGFRDSEMTSLQLARSEVHLFAEGTGGAASTGEYLDAFFLGSEGKLETLGSASSTLSSNKIPRQVAIYQGTADFPTIGKVPMRMRLALDRNNSVIMSWVQEQRRRAQSVPFEGVMTCESESYCTYTGDDVFAQVWSENPDPDPECDGGMPLGGMRTLHFTRSQEAIKGKVTDPVCVVRGHEETGIPFSLIRLDSGLW